MRPTMLTKALPAMIRAGRPVMLWGPPGVGKSDVMRQVAAAEGMDLLDTRALLLDPVDLRGIPAINGDNLAHWCTPAFFPRPGCNPTVWLLDELTAAPQLVQAALYQLILDRKLGEYAVPDGVYICGAGNRQQDRAVSNRMPSALANRLVHVTYEVDNDDWVEWALQSSRIEPEIVAFIRLRPELLHMFDPAKNTDHAFPTPRSWEFTSDILRAKPEPATEHELISGTVGEGAATELVAFLQIRRELPNPLTILMQPDTAAVPKADSKNGPAALYAISTALPRLVTSENADRFMIYANRLPAEFSMLTVTDCIKVFPEVQTTTGFQEWAEKHHGIVS